MQSKNSLKYLLLVFTITGIIYILRIYIPSSFYTKIISPISNYTSVYLPSVKSIPNTNSGTQSNLSNSKIHLSIPKININAPIISVWLTANWEMDTAKDADTLAWFNLGPYPWEIGNAVIAWHYGTWKNGKISVFHDLYKLIKGDKIYFKDKNWALIPFIVREIKIYNSNDKVPELFYSNDNKSHLNLITCEGIWDKILKTYPQRLVVFTDKE